MLEKLTHFIIAFSHNIIFISGNGASGKSTFSKNLKVNLETLGKTVRLFDTDDFLLDSIFRKSQVKIYQNKNDDLKTSYFSTSCSEAYNFEPLYTALNTRLDNDIIIVEGVGASFAKQPQSLGVFITVDKELEFERRLNRNRSSADLSKKRFDSRYEQFELFVLPLKEKFELELVSQKNFSFEIVKDELGIFDDL